jgi:hypothetical protein
VLNWIGDQLQRFSFGVGGGPGILGNLVSLAILAGVIFLLVLVVRAVLRRTRVPKRLDGDELTIELEGGRDSTDWRTDAERYEAVGQWREAMRARYRELVRTLIEDGVLEDIPGRTTGEYRNAFVRARPDSADSFIELTGLFEAVWYGGVETDAADNQRFRELAVRCRHREPVAV